MPGDPSYNKRSAIRTLAKFASSTKSEETDSSLIPVEANIATAAGFGKPTIVAIMKSIADGIVRCTQNTISEHTILALPDHSYQADDPGSTMY